MKTTKKTFAALSTAALLTFASFGAAQTMSVNNYYGKSFGNSDAGVTCYTNIYGAAGLSRTYVAGSGGMYSTLPYWNNTLAGSASGKAYADIRFLGESARAAEFRMNLAAAASFKQYTNGSISGQSCTSSGSVYLRVANSVLWNKSFTSTFNGRATYQLKAVAPYLLVWFGAGAVELRGAGYGKLRAAMDATFDPCAGQVRMNGEAAASGNGSASVTVYSVFLSASVSLSFYANEQKLDANYFTCAPSIGGSTSWGRTGSVYFYRGSMRGLIELDAIAFPIIPYSTTLANWSSQYTSMRLL